MGRDPHWRNRPKNRSRGRKIHQCVSPPQFFFSVSDLRPAHAIQDLQNFSIGNLCDPRPELAIQDLLRFLFAGFFSDPRPSLSIQDLWNLENGMILAIQDLQLMLRSKFCSNRPSYSKYLTRNKAEARMFSFFFVFITFLRR